MPTYEYRCSECGEHLEVVQGFRDDSLTECGLCGGALRKVFGSVGIVFKGSGFYKTDSRSGSKASTSSNGTSGSDSSSSKSADSKSAESKSADSKGADSKSDTSSSSKGSDSSGSSSSGSSSAPVAAAAS